MTKGLCSCCRARDLEWREEKIVAATAIPGLEERGGKVWVLLLLPCPTGEGSVAAAAAVPRPEKREAVVLLLLPLPPCPDLRKGEKR